MKRSILYGLLIVGLLSPAAYAQGKKPYDGYFAAGFSPTEGITADYLNDGWQISGGAIIRPSPDGIFAVRIDSAYNYWDATNQSLDIGGSSNNVKMDGGHGSMFTITADGLLEFGGNGKVGGYIGVGLGVYRRYAELHEEVLVPGYYCDPWWGVCYSGLVEGDVIISDDKLTKLGYQAVAGVTFPLKSGAEVYLEVGYNRQTSTKPTEYIPILFGYRW